MSKKRPIVSVAMVTYNQEKFIKQAIDSILMQKVDFDYEIVIGEDKSPDNTRKILLEYKNKYPERFKLILREKNIGPTKNLYDVFKNCSGKYIAILEGDDYWTDNKKLKIQVDFLNRHENYIACFHKVIFLDMKLNKTTKILNNSNKDIIYGIKDLNKHIKRYGVIQIQSLVFKNIFYTTNSIYGKVLTKSKYLADYPLSYILSSLGRMKIIHKTMGVYRYNSVLSSYSSQNLKLKYREGVKALSGLMEFLPDNKLYFYKWFIRNTSYTVLKLLKSFSIKESVNFYISLSFISKILVPIYGLFLGLKYIMVSNHSNIN